MGSLSPMVQIDLDAGEKIFAQSGSLMFKTESITMRATGMRRGVKGIFKRLLTSETFLFLELEGPGTVGLSPFFPGSIKEILLEEGESIHVNKGAFLFADSTVDFDVDWVSQSWYDRFKMGFLGGEGFFFQRLTGPGKIFLYVCGDIIDTYMEENQTIDIEQGALLFKDVNVEFDLKRIKGLKRIFFSGAGLFMCHLKGPGRLSLQTMDSNRFIGRITAPLTRR